MKESQKNSQQESQVEQKMTSSQMQMTTRDCLFNLTDKQPFTPQDKFYIMSEKNHDLELLVKEFNLQFV